MTDSWDERRDGIEGSYFDRANKESLARLARKQQQAGRLSPATGHPMEHIVAFGAIVDRCTTSGGIWLDGQYSLFKRLYRCTSKLKTFGKPGEGGFTESDYW